MLRSATRRLLNVSSAAVSPDVKLVAAAVEKKLDGLSPRAITDILDSYIIGQKDGKKAVAIALRNRWRRRQLGDEALRREVVPKNMLLIGPTGVGKTEISRRMARITDAPFVKVEATRYTEVGFKGKDVDSIIEELYSNAKSKARHLLEAERHNEALTMALDAVYSAWMAAARLQMLDEQSRNAASIDVEKEEQESTSTAAKRKAANTAATTTSGSSEASSTEGTTQAAGEAAGEADATTSSSSSSTTTTEAPRPKTEVQLPYFRDHYLDEFQDDVVMIEVTAPTPPTKPQAAGSIDLQSVGMLLGLGEAKKPKLTIRRKVSEAVPLMTQEALRKLIDDASVASLARAMVEEDGVVFLDEIDKVVSSPSARGSDVSTAGVQQDLLPLVEGCNVSMKDESVISTNNILFICSGAFHTSKPSDMIAELQGRLPVRVELTALTEEDFRRILTEPTFNLLRQQREMLKTEAIDVEFSDDGIRQLAKVTCQVNQQGQNIGARRLNTILERVMDEYSFQCEDYANKKVVIDAEVVKNTTEKLQKNLDLAKYLL